MNKKHLILLALAATAHVHGVDGTQHSSDAINPISNDADPTHAETLNNASPQQQVIQIDTTSAHNDTILALAANAYVHGADKTEEETVSKCLLDTTGPMQGIKSYLSLQDQGRLFAINKKSASFRKVFYDEKNDWVRSGTSLTPNDTIIAMALNHGQGAHSVICNADSFASMWHMIREKMGETLQSLGLIVKKDNSTILGPKDCNGMRQLQVKKIEIMCNPVIKSLNIGQPGQCSLPGVNITVEAPVDPRAHIVTHLTDHKSQEIQTCTSVVVTNKGDPLITLYSPDGRILWLKQHIDNQTFYNVMAQDICDGVRPRIACDGDTVTAQGQKVKLSSGIQPPEPGQPVNRLPLPLAQGNIKLNAKAQEVQSLLHLIGCLDVTPASENRPNIIFLNAIPKEMMVHMLASNEDKRMRNFFLPTTTPSEYRSLPIAGLIDQADTYDDNSYIITGQTIDGKKKVFLCKEA